MTFEEIERRIALGEDSSLEFKSLSASPSRVLSPDSRDVADEIAAAANASGATFLFGVDDKAREILGTTDAAGDAGASFPAAKPVAARLL